MLGNRLGVNRTASRSDNVLPAGNGEITGDPRMRPLKEMSSARRQIHKIMNSKVGQEILLLIAALVMTVYFSYRSPFFFTIGNLRNLLEAAAPLGLLCIPVTFLMIGGSIDISGAGMAGLSGMVFVLVTHGGTGSVATGVVLTLLLGLAGGAMNGVLVVTLGINPVISTLGTFTIFEGLANIISNGQTAPLTGFTALGTDSSRKQAINCNSEHQYNSLHHFTPKR